MNKKIICLLLATALSGITLAGCGKTGNSEVVSHSSVISEGASIASEASSEVSELLRLNASHLKSELPASTTTALATMLRNSMSYTRSTGV